MHNLDLNIIKSDFTGYFVAALTDEYIVGIWPDDRDKLKDKTGKILEVRVFNKQGEHKWSRTIIGKDFSYRYLSDETTNYEKPIEGYQLLDVKKIDGKYPTTPGEVYTATGGSYYLPIKLSESDEPVIVYKSYIPKLDVNVPSSVHSYVKDWRLSDFCPNRKREE